MTPRLAGRWAAARLAAVSAMVLATLVLLLPRAAAAQIDPSHRWLTLRTTHFYVHFTAPVEPLARRIAADAERAYTQLSAELHPPRGMIDVVISDDADISNGSATPTPSNRIIVYANPPVSETALRYTNDWGQLVITHELTHIFHLDRTRGIWALGQDVFGRASALFPNLYSPAWLTEGLAVYEESRLAGGGRIEGSEHRMIARAALIEERFPTIGGISLAEGRYPFGETAYSFGSLFVDYLAHAQGPSRVRDFVDRSAANIIPVLIDPPAKRAFGISFTRAWDRFRDSLASTIRIAAGSPAPGWTELTHDGVYVFDPRWLSDSSIVYSGAPGRDAYGAYRVDAHGRRTRVGRRNSRSPNVPLRDGGLLYAQLDFTNPYQERGDLWIQRGGHETQLTFGQRLEDPDARYDGEIVAEQIIPGATRLVRVSADGRRVTPLTTGSYDEQWTEPRWSASGTLIVASRWLHGNISQIVVVDTTGRVVQILSSGRSIESTPSWMTGDAGVLYSSDRTGSTQVYAAFFSAPRRYDTFTTVRVSTAATGLFEPAESPSQGTFAAVHFRTDGYHLGIGRLNDVPPLWQPVPLYRDTVAASGLAPVIVDSGIARPYSAWRTLLPRYWLPTLDAGIDGGYRLGGTTTGADVIGRHAISASLGVPLNDRGGVVGVLSYQYRGLGLPVLQADVSRDWESLGSAFSRDASETIIGEIFRRTTDADLLATWIRQRVRSQLTVTGGASVEQRAHVSTPSNVLALVDSGGALNTVVYPELVGAVGYATYAVPAYAISVEDGVELNVTVRDRLRSGVTGSGAQSLSTVGDLSLFKSLDLPGFAHHVLALRGAGGYADERANGYYLVGGVSGSTFEVIPGYTLGEGRKTFPVRGFLPGTLIGTRAFTGSAEYRLPLVLVGQGPSILPFFLDRASLTLFGDYGTAWCPNVAADRETCSRPAQTDRVGISSAGAELNVNLGVLSWDTPYRFRLGAVRPMENSGVFGQGFSVYLVAGVSF